MKTIILLTFLIFNIQTYGCGSWGFKDLENGTQLSFLINSIEMQDLQKTNPRFIRNVDQYAYFRNSDRIQFLSDGSIEYSRFQGIEKNGKKTFQKNLIGTFKDNILTLNGDPSKYEIRIEQTGKLLHLKSFKDNLLVGEGLLGSRQKSMDLEQARRLASYLIWKKQGIDPFKYVRDWWW